MQLHHARIFLRLSSPAINSLCHEHHFLSEDSPQLCRSRNTHFPLQITILANSRRRSYVEQNHTNLLCQNCVYSTRKWPVFLCKERNLFSDQELHRPNQELARFLFQKATNFSNTDLHPLDQGTTQVSGRENDPAFWPRTAATLPRNDPGFCVRKRPSFLSQNCISLIRKRSNFLGRKTNKFPGSEGGPGSWAVCVSCIVS